MNEPNGIQQDLFEKTHAQAFDAWVKTEFGQWAANAFHRLAMTDYLNNRVQTSRGIWEDVREIVANYQKAYPLDLPPPPAGPYTLNDHFLPYMVTETERRAPVLATASFFRKRARGKSPAEAVRRLGRRLHAELARGIACAQLTEAAQ
jgi:hypothetical protein